LFIAIGGLLLTSLLVNTLGERTFLPRVTLLLILGVIVGRQGFDLLPDVLIDSFKPIADIALLMVGFLLGGKLTFKQLRYSGKQVLMVSACGAVQV
jgi:NhaP-type Na+/H+ or K+/H+ antiporter